MTKLLKIIVCCDNKNGIGVDNKLPWNIKSDMELFRKKTIGNKNNCVIMGKNTFLSIPDKYRPLKDRSNYILTSDPELILKYKDKVTILNNPLDLLHLLKNSHYDEYWVIGGESIYTLIMNKYIHLIKEIHITIINKNYNCNKHFPKITKNYDIRKKIVNEEDNYVHYELIMH